MVAGVGPSANLLWMRAAGHRSVSKILAPTGALAMLFASLSVSPPALAEALKIGGISSTGCTGPAAGRRSPLRLSSVRQAGDRPVDLAEVPRSADWERRSERDATVLLQRDPCGRPLLIDVDTDWVGLELSTGANPALAEFGGDRRWLDPGTTTRIELGARTPRHSWKSPRTATYRRSLSETKAYRDTPRGRSVARFDELYDRDPYPGLTSASVSDDATITFPDLFVPTDATLLAGLASDAAARGRIEVATILADGEEFPSSVPFDLKPGELTRVSVPLGAGSGGRGTIAVRVTTEKATAPVRLVDPELRGAEQVGPPRAERPNVILITLDTVRADHLSIYGYERKTTPTLDEIEHELLVFENAYSQAPSTRPSHFSVFASRYPRDLGIWNNSDPPLPQSELTVAEVLQSAGWRTGAVSSVRFLVSDGGAGQGFDEVSMPLQTEQSQLGKLTTGKAIDFIRSSTATPFFLWVHYFDAHLPYQPIPELRDAFWDGPPPTEKNIEPDLIEKEGFGTVGAIPHREYMTAMYDASILYVDRQIRTLLDYLRENDMLDDTVLILAADHGESLGEHGVYFAHDGLYESNVRVPLVLRLPGGARAGRVEAIVENLGIGATILDTAGLETPTTFRGTSLLDAEPGNGTAFFEQGTLFSGLRAGELKWIDGRGFAEDERFVEGSLRKLRERPALGLYDLQTDPGEVNNLAPERSDDAETLQRRLSNWVRAHDDAKRRAGQREVDPEILERLRALGYTE